MKHLMFACAIWILASTALGQHVSNGGNFVTTEFITRARLIHKFLSERPAHVLNSKINLQKLQLAIDKTIVDLATVPMPRDTLGREVDAYVTPYPCRTPGSCSIILRRLFWDQALRSDLHIYRLVLHEYLRVMSLHDENNEISALLDIDPDYYGRGGIMEVEDLANLDFEIPSDGFELPLFWYISSVNVGYRMKIDSTQGYQSNSSLTISSDFARLPIFSIPGVQAFGTVIQCFDAKPYWGKAVNLSGFVETKNLLYGSAGLWMRVDDTKGGTRILDNMNNRPVYGTTPWRRSDVILFIEENLADKICFGALLMGVGSARFDELRVRVIDEL